VDIFTDAECQEIADEFPPVGKSLRLPSVTLRLNYVIRRMRTLHWVADRSIEKPTVYLWDGLCYRQITRNDMNWMITRVFERCGWLDCREVHTAEVYKQTVARCSHITREKNIYLNDCEDYIVFDNGYYHIHTKTFEAADEAAHAPLHITQRLTVPLLFKEDGSIDDNCPKFKEMLETIVPENKAEVCAMMAHTLTSGIGKGICQVWVGPGKNGKSELTVILAELHGDAVSHVSMGDLLNKNNRFASARLKGMKLNIGSEMTSTEVSPNGLAEIKRTMTNRFLSGEKKGKDPEEWVNTTKHIFDVNDLPLTSAHMDYAFFRRFQIIPFLHIIQEEDQIPEYGKLVFREEGPQIAGYLLSFLDQRNDLIREDAKLAERMWEYYTQSVFVFEKFYCFEDCKSKFTATDDLYATYLRFCDEKVRKAASKALFGRLLKKRGYVRTYREGEGHGYVITCIYPVEVESLFTILNDAEMEKIEREIEQNLNGE